MQKEIMIQPNQITQARYEYTALQKNILYNVISAIQGHMTKSMPVNEDLFKNLIVPIEIKTMAGEGNNHTRVIEAAKEIMKKPVQYQYKDDKGKLHTVFTVLIATADHEHGTSIVKLSIPEKAIPALLYIGGGFTALSKVIAISLRSVYAKRMYELCCRWVDKGGFEITLKEFRRIMFIEDKFKQIGELKDRLLDVAQRELKSSADVWFDYSFKKRDSRSFNIIHFSIHANKMAKGDKKGEMIEAQVELYNILTITYPDYKNDKTRTIIEILTGNGKLFEALLRFRKIEAEYRTGERGKEDVIRLTKHILKEDYNIS